MSESRILKCDNHCGQKMRAKKWADILEDGWLCVYDNHNDEDGLDFCSVDCMITYYTGGETNDE